MPISFQCSHCQNPIKVSQEHAGRKGKCPKCGQVTRIPKASTTDPAQEATVPEWDKGSAEAPIGATMPPPDAPTQPMLKKVVFLGCEVERSLAKGGMGEAFVAHHQALDKKVVVKILKKELSSREEMVARFVQEARAAAKLEHPNVVQVLNVGEQGGVYGIVMQFVEGKSLQDRIKDGGRLQTAEAASLIRDAALGLGAAHGSGIIHRDVKPANILLDGKGRALVTDFGIARLSDTGHGLTKTDQVMGTPHFMAPEQWESAAAVDERSDVFALGVTLYNALSGKLPYQGDTTAQVYNKIMKGKRTPLDEVRDDLPEGLVELAERMIATDPARRPQTMDEIAKALEPFARGAEASSPAAGGLGRRALKGVGRFAAWALLGLFKGAWWLLRKHPKVAIPLYLGLAAAVAAGAFFLTRDPGNNTLEKAVVATPNEEARVRLYPEQDEDWFQIRFNGAGYLVPHLLDKPKELGEPTFDLVDPESKRARAMFFRVESKTYHLKVALTDIQRKSYWPLSLALDFYPDGVDAFEPNNTIKEAHPITMGRPVLVGAYGMDPEVFKVVIEDPGRLSVHTSQSPWGTTATILDAAGKELAQSPAERLTHAKVKSGTFFVRFTLHRKTTPKPFWTRVTLEEE